jgi:enoyl-CoA hydratase/carnithine racemase
LSQQIGIAHALRLGMTGERIQVKEALAIGLVQETAEDQTAALQRAHSLAKMAAQNSPTAVAAFKAGLLQSLGAQAEIRGETEAKAYEHCVDSGQAKIGRENFDLIRRGDVPAWGPRLDWMV